MFHCVRSQVFWDVSIAAICVRVPFRRRGAFFAMNIVGVFVSEVALGDFFVKTIALSVINRQFDKS